MEKGISCSTETFELLASGLAKVAEDNNISPDEFVAFVYEFPRLLLGDKYKDIVYVVKPKD